MVHTRSTDLLKISGGDEAVPMLGQQAVGGVFAQTLGERVFVDGGFSSFLEQRWRNPGLKDQPSSEVDASHLVVIVIKRKTPRLHAAVASIKRLAKDDREWDLSFSYVAGAAFATAKRQPSAARAGFWIFEKIMMNRDRIGSDQVRSGKIN